MLGAGKILLVDSKEILHKHAFVQLKLAGNRFAIIGPQHFVKIAILSKRCESVGRMPITQPVGSGA